MFFKFRILRESGAVAVVAGIVVLMACPAAADPNKILEIKVKQVVFYESANGEVVGRIAREKFKVPLDIDKISPNGRLFLVTIDGEELWIPKLLTRTNELAPEVAVKCQSITKSYASTRGFGKCE